MKDKIIQLVLDGDNDLIGLGKSGKIYIKLLEYFKIKDGGSGQRWVWEIINVEDSDLE